MELIMISKFRYRFKIDNEIVYDTPEQGGEK